MNEAFELDHNKRLITLITNVEMKMTLFNSTFKCKYFYILLLFNSTKLVIKTKHKMKLTETAEETKNGLAFGSNYLPGLPSSKRQAGRPDSFCKKSPFILQK